MASDPQVSDIDLALNPYVLEKFGESEVTAGMMKGAGLQEWMQKQQMYLLVSVIIAAATLILLVIKTGVFQSVGAVVPGLG